MTSTSSVVAAWLLASAAAAQAADAVIASPDGRVARRIAEDGSRFSVTRHGETVIAAAPLGLDLNGAPALGRLALASRHGEVVDRRIPLVATEAASARVPLRCLPPGRWRATVWMDGDLPREVRRSVRTVGSADLLTLSLAAAGGAAVILEPLP